MAAEPSSSLSPPIHQPGENRISGAQARPARHQILAIESCKQCLRIASPTFHFSGCYLLKKNHRPAQSRIQVRVTLQTRHMKKSSIMNYCRIPVFLTSSHKQGAFGHLLYQANYPIRVFKVKVAEGTKSTSRLQHKKEFSRSPSLLGRCQGRYTRNNHIL